MMGYTKPGIALQSGIRDSVGLVWVKGTTLWCVFDLVHTAGLNAQIRFFAEIRFFCAVVYIVI